jgi:hypothetical protein
MGRGTRIRVLETTCARPAKLGVAGQVFQRVPINPAAAALVRRRTRCLAAAIVLHRRDANGQALAYVYYELEPGRRSAAHLLTRDETRRIAANIAKLPDSLRKT